jgi:Heterokaryon incompatibility protein (HET)
MRLLTRDSRGKLALQMFHTDDVPPYAILSHTWHTDNSKEVDFRDLQADGGAELKDGYNKLLFCEKQARKDGLQYFWVDTCCIDKTSSAELTEAINSMFQWYQESTKCYVYLPDVTSSQRPWKEAFQHSRWFSRGWTLQELVAPRVVEFFTSDGMQLGSKLTLEVAIHKATGIGADVLRGEENLAEYHAGKKLLWAVNRRTTKVEDRAYCLLGIFGVFMPPLYGEGLEHALKRLKNEIKKSVRGECVSYMCATYVINLTVHPLENMNSRNFKRIDGELRNGTSCMHFLTIQLYYLLRRQNRCLHCGVQGHWLGSCYASEETVQQFRLRFELCYQCGSSGHFAVCCPWDTTGIADLL